MLSKFSHKKISKSSIIIIVQIIVLAILLAGFFLNRGQTASETAGSLSKQEAGPLAEQEQESDSEKKDYIRWVDFTIPANIMNKSLELDINSCQDELHYNWIELLAFLGARYGGDFSRFKQADLDGIVKRLTNGETMEEITKDMKYYAYYHEAYSAVLGGMVGYFEQETSAPTAVSETDGTVSSNPVSEKNSTTWVQKYGLKAFSPIAKGFPYSDYDDFGVSRSYGYKRQHLGHDMMGQVGTPVIAVESGYIEALGWNQYGGWRIGIRSFDKKRYYYYAHLRKNYPYQSNLEVGSTVIAGDVIGYLGRTGYSKTENTNNIDTPHLHFGLQLIFDESQKEGNNEIWIDCYELTKFLHQNQSQVVKVEGTKEWTRVYRQKEPSY